MGEIKHTPWSAHKLDDVHFDDWTIMRQDGLAFAAIVHNGDITPEETASHAHLITAAPEMKEALEALISVMEATECDRLFRADYAKAKAALAKANGEAPQ